MKNLNQNLKTAVTFITAVFFMNACGQSKTSQTMSTGTEPKHTAEKPATSSSNIDTVTFGAGCFWCVEAIFQRLNGVISVKSGYSGGGVKNPSYREVCGGNTGHAEVCQVVYDKNKISFDELLEVFWKTHDPTTMNRQGNDVGTQYRSAVFYHTEEQKQLAEKYKKALNDAKAYPDPVITEITPFTNFYPAEDYHQDYFNLNGSEPYCKFVIQPKVDKLEKVFKDKLKH
jgi:peptide-methionine (S)-S-oxide reductase